MSERPETAPSGTPVQRFLDRHLLLFCTLMLVVFATLRVYFVSRFDLPTALTVLAIVDRTQLLTATVLSAVTFLAPLLFVQANIRKWMLAGNTLGAGFKLQVRTAILWIPLSGLILVGFSVPLILGWFLGWLIFLFLKFRARKKGTAHANRDAEPPTPPGHAGTLSWLFATMVGVTLLTVLNQPWLAREAIQVSGGEDVVGSVVGVQGDMTLLLERPASSARWIKTDEIESRAICRSAPRWYISSPASFIPRPGEDCEAILSRK